MKLHLGCGNYYLKGYINIDLPTTKESRPLKNKVDVHKDILRLQYPNNSIDEIRLHHVFEHFTRPIVCALISAWYLWLKPIGILHIEVPDFYKTAKVILKPFISKKLIFSALRHLGGSHQADWAVHCEAYTIKSLSMLVKRYGFKIIKTSQNQWKGTYNFEIIAQKKVLNLTLDNLEDIACNYLKLFLIDESEIKLLQVWLDIYKKQMERFSFYLKRI